MRVPPLIVMGLTAATAGYPPLALDELHESYAVSKAVRLERLGKQLTRITEELEQRDLSEISIGQLVKLLLMLEKQVAETIDPLEFKEEPLFEGLITSVWTDSWQA